MQALKDIHSELILVGSVPAALGSAVTRGGRDSLPLVPGVQLLACDPNSFSFPCRSRHGLGFPRMAQLRSHVRLNYHGIRGTMGPQAKGWSQLSGPTPPSRAPASLPLPARPAANNEGVGADNSRQLPHS